jgi:putative transcriptional regulator
VLLVALAAVLRSAPGRADGPPKSQIVRGKLLVASEQLVDPNFAETVILLLENTSEGALGVVINRPTEVKLSTLLPDVEQLRDREDTAFLGGPVARDRMILLVRAKSAPTNSELVVDGVFITASLDALHDLPADKHSDSNVRAYVGYAGWAPEQLDEEIEHGDWHLLPADAATLFQASPDTLWSELNERSSGEWVRRAPRGLPVRMAAAHADAQRSIGGVAFPPAARNACRASTLALTS